MNVAKLVEGDRIRWWCPGCDSNHVVSIGATAGWGFNDDLVHPTLTPSVLVVVEPVDERVAVFRAE